jgi:catechol 2,3-dioxygenase-like lactoylglutathione lyase family enzyme
MTRPAISGVALFFIVADVPAALSFYRDMLGFEITFRGPTSEDEFFGIVRRDAAMIMFKALDVEPLPNYNRKPSFSWATTASPRSVGMRISMCLIRTRWRRNLRPEGSPFPYLLRTATMVSGAS